MGLYRDDHNKRDWRRQHYEPDYDIISPLGPLTVKVREETSDWERASIAVRFVSQDNLLLQTLDTRDDGDKRLGINEPPSSPAEKLLAVMDHHMRQAGMEVNLKNVGQTARRQALDAGYQKNHNGEYILTASQGTYKTDGDELFTSATMVAHAAEVLDAVKDRLPDRGVTSDHVRDAIDQLYQGIVVRERRLDELKVEAYDDKDSDRPDARVVVNTKTSHNSLHETLRDALLSKGKELELLVDMTVANKIASDTVTALGNVNVTNPSQVLDVVAESMTLPVEDPRKRNQLIASMVSAVARASQSFGHNP